MNINLVVISNYFSETIVKLSSDGDLNIIYRAHKSGLIGKALKLLLLIITSWLSRLLPGSARTLYIPHSYKKFGLIIKFCNFDNLVLIDDGVSFLSAQKFQEKYIFSLIRSCVCKDIIACDDHLLGNQNDLNANIKTIKRSSVVREMISSYNIESTFRLDLPHMIIIDNGTWSEEECSIIIKKVNTKFNLNCLLVLHPVRDFNINIGAKLDVPFENWWASNQQLIKGLVCNFSTVAVNLKSIYPDLDIYFIPPHTTDHLGTIKKINGKWL
jgi:hypothetical protein